MANRQLIELADQKVQLQRTMVELESLRDETLRDLEDKS
jgi:hypothetical protein